MSQLQRFPGCLRKSFSERNPSECWQGNWTDGHMERNILQLAMCKRPYRSPKAISTITLLRGSMQFAITCHLLLDHYIIIKDEAVYFILHYYSRSLHPLIYFSVIVTVPITSPSNAGFCCGSRRVIAFTTSIPSTTCPKMV
jgi:hypothetical protein